MAEQGTHIFRDPIHDFIKVSDMEKELVDSKPFQRLRRIRQLGLSNLVYQGADHYRFAHSLGTMEFASRIFDTIIHHNGEELASLYKWNEGDFERNKVLLRTAALLHDIGHPPFSHSSEGLFPDGEKHETFGLKIIASDPIKSIIDSYKDKTGVTTDDVSELLGPTPLREKAFLQQILIGEVDVDRMDYLLRDAYYTGVSCGTFDYQRLVEMVRAVEDERDPGSPKVAVEEGGRHAAEGMIIARYLMFTQVYFHAVRRVYDIHLTDVIQEMLGEGNRYPTDMPEYLKWDDIKVMAWIKEQSEEGTSENARRIWQRQHFECVGETSEHPEPYEVDEFHKKVKKIEEKFGHNAIKTDRADKLPYNFKQSQLLIKKRHIPGNRPFFEESKLVGSLEGIYQLRAYTNHDISDEARKIYYG
jgi:HD superfamily phosphohydrolase